MKPVEIVYRLDQSGKTQADLARHLGLDPAIINRMLKGGRKITSEEADAIRAFLPEQDKPQPAARKLESGGEAVQIAEIDVRAGAGGGGIVVEDYMPGEGGMTAVDAMRAQWGIPHSFLRELVGVRDAGRIQIVEIMGDSNEPELFSGDRVMVDLAHRIPSPAGFYCLWDGNGVVVKSVEIIPGSEPLRLRLISENKKYSTYEVTADEANIIGRVCGKISRM